MRPRFTIRALLILMAVVAFACYWWVGRPAIFARRFADALARDDVAAADAMCLDPNRRFINRAAYYFRPRGSVNPNSQGEGNLPPIKFAADILPRTWDDLRRGRLRVVLQIMEATPSQIGSGEARISTLGEIIRPGLLVSHPMTATPWGIEPPADATPTWTPASTRLNPGPAK
jgi:hypothetical protein